MPNGLDPVPVPPPPSDSDLAARVARGDRQAETTFVRRYERAVTLVLQQQRLQPDKVHDLAQETFIVVIGRMRDNGIHDPDRIGGFLRQTAINLATGELRKQVRQRTDTDNDSIEFMVDQGLGPPDNLELAQLAAMIDQLMRELPRERDRVLLRRFLVLQEDKAALCAMYSLTSEHFDRVLHRARLRLRELLDERRG